MRSIVKNLLTTATLLALSAGVQAQQAGDNFVGVGIANISPSATLGTLTSVGPAAVPFNGYTAGASASIGSVNTLSLSYLHMFTDNIATELTIGIPPKLTVDVHLQSGDHPGAATAKELTPALVGKYLFCQPKDAFRPYLGLGVTHASFTSVEINSNDALVKNLAGTSAGLSSSWAPVYNLGFIYNFSQNFSLNASVSYIPLKTDVTFAGSGAGTGTTTTGTLTLNPTDYVIRVGYKF